MKKKLASLIILIFCGILLVGCSDKKDVNNESKEPPAVEQQEATKETDEKTTTDDQPIGTKLDTEKIVAENFGRDDKHFDFKVKATREFLVKNSKIESLLDSRYGYFPEEPQGFTKVGDQSQLRYRNQIEDYDNRYQYIMQVDYVLAFNDDKSQLTFQNFRLTLCDIGDKGKIEMNDAVKEMLQTVYPAIDLNETQNKINEAIEAEKNKDFKLIALDNNDKYYRVTFDRFKYEDNPIEITIDIQTYKDYPVE